MATKTSKAVVVAEIAAGLAAVGAAAGYYFYGSDNAKKHRVMAAKWAADMKREVGRETKRLKNIDSEDYARIVGAVAKRLSAARQSSLAEGKRVVKKVVTKARRAAKKRG